MQIVKYEGSIGRFEVLKLALRFSQAHTDYVWSVSVQVRHLRLLYI
jgi:hypothetical protein